MFIVLLFYTHQKFMFDMVLREYEEYDYWLSTEQRRQKTLFIYLDILASVGGLTIPLYFVGRCIIKVSNCLTGNELLIYFLKHLYKEESDEFKQSNKSEASLPSIMKRKPFLVRV